MQLDQWLGYYEKRLKRALDMIIGIHEPGISEVNHYMVVVIQEHLQHRFCFTSHFGTFYRQFLVLLKEQVKHRQGLGEHCGLRIFLSWAFPSQPIICHWVHPPHPYLPKESLGQGYHPSMRTSQTFSRFLQRITLVFQMLGPSFIIIYVIEQRSIDHLSSSRQLELNVWLMQSNEEVVVSKLNSSTNSMILCQCQMQIIMRGQNSDKLVCDAIFVLLPM